MVCSGTSGVWNQGGNRLNQVILKTVMKMALVVAIRILATSFLALFVIIADILGGRLSGDLHCCGQATPAVCRHRTTLCTQDKDHAGDEEFHGRRSSYLEQSTWHPANCNSLLLDVCWTSECSPVWFTEGARLRTIYDVLYKSTHHHHHHHPRRLYFFLRQ